MNSLQYHLGVAFDILNRLELSQGQITLTPKGDHEKEILPLIIAAGFIAVCQNEEKTWHVITWKGKQFHHFYKLLEEDGLLTDTDIVKNPCTRLLFLFY